MILKNTTHALWEVYIFRIQDDFQIPYIDKGIKHRN